MNRQLQASLPQTVLDDGCTVVAEAIDPTTGLTIPNVLVSDFAIYATEFSAATNPQDEVAPLFLPIPIDAAGNV